MGDKVKYVMFVYVIMLDCVLCFNAINEEINIFELLDFVALMQWHFNKKKSCYHLLDIVTITLKNFSYIN